MSNSFGLVSSVPGIILDIEISKIQYSTNLLRGGLPGVVDLAESIRYNGLLQPIVVRPKDDRFEVVAGNRRRKACEILRWKKVPCHVVELDDKKAFEFSLIENIQRETLSVIEEAEAFKAYVTDFGWGGVSELARKIGKSPSYVTKRIKLLNMPQEIINSITDMALDASVAEELCSVKDPSLQSELAALVTRRHLSLRQTRELVNRRRAGSEDDDDGSAAGAGVRDGDGVKGEPLGGGELEHKQKAFDKLIVILRIALNNAGQLIDDNEDDWIVRETLMQHRNVLHGQIDLLIKEKRKLGYRLFGS